jgi:putative transposase
MRIKLAESDFSRPTKYRPEFPNKGFADLDAARHWAVTFVDWYNHNHRHSGNGSKPLP